MGEPMTLTLPEPYASAIVHGIAGWHTSQDPPPQELVGQRLIVVADDRIPIGSPEGWRTKKADGEYRWTLLQDRKAEPRIDLHPGCIVGAVTVAERVSVVEAEVVMPDHRLDAEAAICIVKGPQRMGLWKFGAGHWWLVKDISDQLPWADWSPGRWAWRFENPKPTTQECPVCGGRCGTSGSVPYTIARWRTPCLACHGDGTCSPTPYSASEGLAEFDPGRLR